MKSSEFAYAAGMFDGEGSASLIVRHRAGKKPWHETVVQISMVRREALDWLSERWGGKVGVYRNNDRAYYKWSLYTARARSFLVDILPYVQIKTKVIALILSIPPTVGFDAREEIRASLMAENARRPLMEIA